MEPLITYQVLSRIRRNGTVYKPNGDNAEIELTEAEAAPLLALKCIAEPEPQEEPEPSFDLIATLRDLLEAGNDLKAMNMDQIKSLLGKEGSNVKRKEVDAALAQIEQEKAG